MSSATTILLKWKAIFWDRLRINWKLAPLKVLLLLVSGAMGSLYPFLTIHMKSLGITMTEIALIYATLPFVCFIGPPIGGAIADRIGNYRLVFVIYTLLCVVTHMMMWFGVPSAMPKIVETRRNLTDFSMELGCVNSSHRIPVRTDYNGSCTTAANQSIELNFRNCKTDCPLTSRPKICLSDVNHSYVDCSEYDEFNFLYVRHGGLKFENDTVQLVNFTGEERRPVTSMYCLQLDNHFACNVSCAVETHLTLTCKHSIPSENRAKTLGWYIFWRFLAGIAMGTLSPIMDAIAYQMSKEHGGDLGFQRMFMLVGMAAFPPASGYFVGLASAVSKSADFSPAFYLFGSLFTVSAVIAYFMSLDVRMPAENIWMNIGKILRNPKVTAFVIMMFLTGGMWGFLENFLFVFMEDDLKSEKWLMGMTGTVAALSAIPVVACSTFIMKYLGHTKIVMITCLLYGCRFLAYSFTYDPFLILPVEVLEAFTTSLLWVVASVYCGKVAPDYLATLQGVIGAAHAAIGRGVGCLIGGIMFEHLKPRLTYQIFAGGCFFCAVMYAILHFAWLRRIKHDRRPSSAKYDDRNGELTASQHGLTEVEEKNLEDFAESEALSPFIGRTRPLNRSLLDLESHEKGNSNSANGIHSRHKEQKADMSD